LGVKIADEFKKGFDALIMENHSTVLGGTDDLVDSFQRFEVLEFCAPTILYGTSLGEVHFLTDDLIDDCDKQWPNLMAKIDSVSYPSDEREKRLEICNIIHRACDYELMLSSYGTLQLQTLIVHYSILQ